MPLWTDAYLADTGHLTTLEHGAYFLLLMAMWRSPTKSLPVDDVRLARICRLALHQWRRIKPTILEFLTLDEESMTYTQGRLRDESRAVEQKRESQRTNAKAKWRKYRETRDAVASKRQSQTDASLNPYPLPPTPTDDSTNHLSEHAPLTNGHAKQDPKPDTKRGTRLTEHWRPSGEAVQHCKQELGCSRDLLKQEFPNFQCHFLAATGAGARKIDWDRTFINWMRRARRDEIRHEQRVSRRPIHH